MTKTKKKYLKLKQLMRFFQPYLHVKEFPLSSRMTEHTHSVPDVCLYKRSHVPLAFYGINDILRKSRWAKSVKLILTLSM